MVDWCYLCKGDGELVNHVFLHCPGARGLWKHIVSMVNLYWVMPERVGDVLVC